MLLPGVSLTSLSLSLSLSVSVSLSVCRSLSLSLCLSMSLCLSVCLSLSLSSSLSYILFVPSFLFCFLSTHKLSTAESYVYARVIHMQTYIGQAVTSNGSPLPLPSPSTPLPLHSNLPHPPLSPSLPSTLPSTTQARIQVFLGGGGGGGAPPPTAVCNILFIFKPTDVNFPLPFKFHSRIQST